MKDCGTPKVLEIKCPGEVVLLHKVIVTTDMGDETTFPPKIGLYKNVLLQYQSSGNIYLYSSDGIPTKIEDTADIARLEQMIEDETEARILKDEDLQDQIDTIKAASDVVDIVGSYAELEAYDTSKLNDNDIIKVLEDETHDDDITYYRWSTTTETFTYIGAQAAYYSKGETDTLLSGKQDTLVAGSNIQIAEDGVTISATDTTYSNFVGTDGQTAGSAGLVPAPATTDDGKYLKSDGTWATLVIPPSVNVINTIATDYASASTTDAMGQQGVYLQVHNSNNGIQIGGNSLAATASYSTAIAIGGNSIASNANTVALGNNAKTNSSYATALGSSSYAYRQYSTAVGYNSLAYGLYSVALGASSGTGTSSSSSYGQYTVAIGYSTSIMGSECVAVGAGALAGSSNACSYNTAVGRSASAGVYSNNNTAIGYKATTRGQSGSSTAIGANANNNATNYGTTLGAEAKINTGDYNVAIGYRSKADTGNSSDPHYNMKVVSFGDGSNSANYGKRMLINVADGTEASDAATVGQLPTTMTGASSSVAGTGGLVPAPAAGDEAKFLQGDGTWATVQSGGASILHGSVSLYYYPDQTPHYTFDTSHSYNAIVAADGAFLEEFNDGVVYQVIGYEEELYTGRAIVWITTDGKNIIELTFNSTSALAGEWSKFTAQGQLTAGTNINIASDGTISATDTTYSDFTGATASVAGVHGLVPAPASGDQSKVLHGDGTWKDATAKLVEMSYGESNAWAKFIAAYNAGSIVYCRASSNANPGSGSQTRKAFMAYVNNATNPTSVEFQYVRSNSSKTDSQQCDQVFVYKLTNASGGTWTVESRDMATKINVDSTLNKTYSSGANASMTLGAKAMTGATSSVAGTAGYVPAPAAGDEDKFLAGDGTWKTAGGGKEVTIVVSDLRPSQYFQDAFMELQMTDYQAAQQYETNLNGNFYGTSGYFAFLNEGLDHYLTIDELGGYFRDGYKINVINGLNMYGGSTALQNMTISGMVLNASDRYNEFVLMTINSDQIGNQYMGLFSTRKAMSGGTNHNIYTGRIS